MKIRTTSQKVRYLGQSWAFAVLSLLFISGCVVPAEDPDFEASDYSVQVTTLAGTGAIGSDDGTGSSATFNYPMGVAVDQLDAVYVTDSDNNKIRKISSSGNVTTLAGTGANGSSDGPALEATFRSLFGIAVSDPDMVYLADSGNHRIRLVLLSSYVTILAGSGTPGFDNGKVEAASFNFPSGIATDGSGNVYVADTGNHSVRITTPLGLVMTLAGTGSPGANDGPGAIATFRSPTGIAVDSSGTVFVADTQNHLIRKITPGGAVSTFAGSGSAGSDDGMGTAASFSSPGGIAVSDGGYLYVADTNNHMIRKITPEGFVSTLAGTGATGSDDGPGSEASFYYPYGIAIGSQGSLFVADAANNKIRKLTRE